MSYCCVCGQGYTAQIADDEAGEDEDDDACPGEVRHRLRLRQR